METRNLRRYKDAPRLARGQNDTEHSTRQSHAFILGPRNLERTGAVQAVRDRTAVQERCGLFQFAIAPNAPLILSRHECCPACGIANYRPRMTKSLRRLMIACCCGMPREIDIPSISRSKGRLSMSLGIPISVLTLA